MTDDTWLLDRIAADCGATAVLTPQQAEGRQIAPWGTKLGPVPILRPASTADVVAIVKRCREAGRSLVPLGGASGFAAGTLPATGEEWYLSLERMRTIEFVDPVSRIAVVDAGVVLQTVQEAAAAAGMLFPVDLGGRGSATIGGLISTNAGGERVLRFGMTREHVLGLEVVLADGSVLNLMDRVVKNNAGYDLKQLFIGSEGTLGIVTRAVLRLRPAFAGNATGFIALRALDDVPAVLSRLESGLGGTLSAFELMWPEFYETMTGGAEPKHRPPVAAGAEAYLLLEAEGGDPARDRERFEALLAALLDEGLVGDAAIAHSDADRGAFWAIRNDIPHLLANWSPTAGFDVSVPIAEMRAYVDELRAALRARWPAVRMLVFGHVADNNLHIGVNVGPDTPEHKAEIGAIVYAGIPGRHGSISAEHGIGLEKREALAATKPAEALALMRQLKQILDPAGLLNPGKVL